MTWAHPRSRGENTRSRISRVSASGSSPLTRGKPSAVGVRAPLERLIPAHAGKTSHGPSRARARTAHPRSRGENCPGCPDGCWGRGSSPLTRGKPVEAGRTIADARLIPAHAGKTRCPRGRSGRGQAHPRSRGENVAKMTRGGSTIGSSPLTRGKHHEPPWRRRRQRLIPAHAGKTVPR